MNSPSALRVSQLHPRLSYNQHSQPKAENQRLANHGERIQHTSWRQGLKKTKKQTELIFFKGGKKKEMHKMKTSEGEENFKQSKILLRKIRHTLCTKQE